MTIFNGICELILYMCVLVVCFFLYSNDTEYFLKDGQERHWTGVIQNEWGETCLQDSVLELLGFKGNPLYWVW
jgi:hypothetical protein